MSHPMSIVWQFKLEMLVTSQHVSIVSACNAYVCASADSVGDLYSITCTGARLKSATLKVLSHHTVTADVCTFDYSWLTKPNVDTNL